MSPIIPSFYIVKQRFYEKRRYKERNQEQILLEFSHELWELSLVGDSNSERTM